MRTPADEVRGAWGAGPTIMVSPGGNPVEEPLDYRARLVGDALRQQAWVIVLCVLVGVGLGYAASVARPGSYVATTTVLITPLVGNPYSPGVTGQDSLVSIETEAKVASSNNVSAGVAVALSKSGTAVDSTTLEKGVTVSVPPSTQIIEIAYASKDPAFAQAAAAEFVTQYLAVRKAAAVAVNASQIAVVQTQLTEVNKKLAEARANGASTTSLDSQKATLSAQLVGLSEPDAGHVISKATTPVKTSGLGRPLYLVGGALFGLALGIVVALARQRRDDRIYHPDEIDAAGIPVIASFDDSTQQSAEAVRLIRSHVLALSETSGVVVVGPAEPGDIRSPVGDHLVESLAKVGQTVLFVDLAPDSAAEPGAKVRHGFTDLLTGDRKSARHLVDESSPHLMTLPRGRAELGDAIEYLDAERLSKMLGELPREVDYVVLDAAALTDSVGQRLMRTADLIVVTTTLGRSTRHEIATLKSRGDERVVACLTPRVHERRRLVPWRSRKEGSTQVSRRGESLTIVDVDGEEKSA